MSTLASFFKHLIVILITSIFVITAVLEFLSAYHKCKAPGGVVNLCDSQNYINGEADGKLLDELKEKRKADENISKDEYKHAFEKLIIEVEPETIKGLNGQACGYFGFVKNNLPAQSKLFVKRHELEHLLQTGQERNPEFSANIVAAKEYPLGLIQTTAFSLKERMRLYESPLCFVLESWKTFKTYFLPF